MHVPRRLRLEDPLSSGVQVWFGQHRETQWLLKKKKLQILKSETCISEFQKDVSYTLCEEYEFISF